MLEDSGSKSRPLIFSTGSIIFSTFSNQQYTLILPLFCHKDLHLPLHFQVLLHFFSGGLLIIMTHTQMANVKEPQKVLPVITPCLQRLASCALHQKLWARNYEPHLTWQSHGAWPGMLKEHQHEHIWQSGTPRPTWPQTPESALIHRKGANVNEFLAQGNYTLAYQ